MTNDGGHTWENKSVGLGNLYINSIAIDPYNPKILYAGTYRDKVYKTTNGGESWYQSSNGIQSEAIVYAIAIDPYDADIVYIGTRGENTTSLPPWKGVIYRSKNEGIDWTPVLQNVSVNGLIHKIGRMIWLLTPRITTWCLPPCMKQVFLKAQTPERPGSVL